MLRGRQDPDRLPDDVVRLASWTVTDPAGVDGMTCEDPPIGIAGSRRVCLTNPAASADRIVRPARPVQAAERSMKLVT